MRVVREVRSQLVELGGATEETHSTIIVQGSGTFAVEATIASVVPRHDSLLVISNGAYGERIATIAKTHDIPTVVLRFGERDAATPDKVAKCLQEHPDVKHVALVHHETTAGVLNPVREIASAVARTRPGASIILDSMSAFGAYPVDMKGWGIDYVVSSANKCIEGVPGFAFTIASKDKLAAAAASGLADRPRSISLDLHAQVKGLDASGQFRFTPPTHALLAFHTALKEHTREGGSAGRLKRYFDNFMTLKRGMAALGFTLYVPDGPAQGCIISTFLWPDDPAFDFNTFYSQLAARGHVIYPGKLTRDNCFRIGSIGRLYPSDVEALLAAIKEVLAGMGVRTPVKQLQPSQAAA